jgi:multiple sugar transport system substrate-binding protein
MRWFRTSLKGVVLAGLSMFVASCAPQDKPTSIVIQRFFGECGAVYGNNVDVQNAQSECGILTTIINKFMAENPEIDVRINVVAWPGYPQLSAQIAAGDPPDLVTMHQSVISDYQARGLLLPMDDVLAEAGLPRTAFTAAGQRGAIKAGQMYAMPWDTIGGLFHINTALMQKAGLMRDDQPVLPTSPRELLDHARRFRAATGLPYLVQAQVNDPATHVRNLYTWLMAQDQTIFPDSRHIRINTPQAQEIVTLLKTLNDENFSTRNQDFSAATQTFTNGEGAIFPVGTWMIGPYQEEADNPARPLYRAYAVRPYPRLWGRDAAFVDGHAWVMPRQAHSPEQRAAIVAFLKFIALYNKDWTRTGHLPSLGAVLGDESFKAQPHRASIAAMAATGQQLPDFVQRQSAIQGLLGEELESAINGQKPVEQALSDAERRINDMLAQILDTSPNNEPAVVDR